MNEKIQAELMAKMSEKNKADFEDSLNVTQEKVVKLITNIEDCAESLQQQRSRKETILATLLDNSTDTHAGVTQLNNAFEKEQEAYKEYLFAVTALSNYISELNSKEVYLKGLRDGVSPKSPHQTLTEKLRAVIEKPMEDFTSEDMLTIISMRWRICSQLVSFDETEIATWLIYIKAHMLDNPIVTPNAI